ncbi:DUF4190 domain-containing protein [Streptomyces sp. ISL-11]|uniref:DUF4190 domain-containing protein n=1 Tax=Streptomyces sp. ISL-11 TaxID=2819174 RepID=UPI001BE7B03B|nr:DUF4190 domain-containing protein [Streptomyces sp. ISL-11]MBT2384667.1 DUF4190 domain-containing protein [Streptomyces sp. ISL-11]
MPTTLTKPRAVPRAPKPEPLHEPPRTPDRSGTADTMAVWAFILGLVGLLIFNLVLGPIALTLATLALTRRTTRRGRAVLGLALGAADLIVLATLMTADHTLSWGLAA